MRNIDEVINKVLTHVPESEKVLRERLSKVKSDAAYRAPEQMRLSWEAGQNVWAVEVEGRGPEDTWPDWFKKALLVWSGQG